MIILNLRGRIGNQLFMYAMAESIRQQRGMDEEIVIYDESVLKLKWEDSLYYYKLPNVRFVHSMWRLPISVSYRLFKISHLYRKLNRLTFNEKYAVEKKLQKNFIREGLILCENGYLAMPIPANTHILISGYFQSELYFKQYGNYIKSLFRVSLPQLDNYHLLADKLQKRNSVCISIKVEHNIGSKLYDVCSIDYYKRAISIILDKVERPLFFICSDNVQFVLDNLIDTHNVDYLCQDRIMRVHETLQMMSYCKHFILSNTSFGWWAQYLGDNPGKIVIAPSKWMRVDMPIDIYDKKWTLIDVSEYINANK